MVLKKSREFGGANGHNEFAFLAAELDRLNLLEKLSDSVHLSLSGDWLHKLLNEVSDYFYVKDRKSRFVMANRQVALDVGLDDASQLIGKTDLELHPRETAEKFMAIEQEIMSSNIPRIDFEEPSILSNGKRKWFASSKFPVSNSEGVVVGLVGMSRDITERKRANQLQQGQNKVLQQIATGKPLPQVLETLVLMIEQQCDGIFGSVMLVDDSGMHLKSGVAPNLPVDYVALTDGIEVSPKMGSCGTAVYRRESVVVDDILVDPLWEDVREAVEPFGLRSCWSVPFFGRDKKVLGTFGLYSRTVRSPTDYELKLALEAARLAAVAVERDQDERKIRYLANHDVLTGLPNRQEFKSKLEEKVAESRTSGNHVAVVFVDLDNFKFVNDSFGHAIGDQVLMIAAERIMTVHDGAHQAIRFGGDEFVLIVEGETAQKPALRDFMARLKDEITKTIQIGDLSFHVTCSIGAACFPEDAENAAQLLRNADKAMFEAKSSGRNGYQIYEQTRPERSVNKLTLLEEMRSGIENGDFFLEYQPQYNLVSGRIIGAEALVRWQHPSLGRLMPGEFIGLAEESGLIVPLGRWVMKEACRQNKAWQDAGLTPITIGVNVSARQFSDVGLVADVTAALEESGMRATYLELELTESLLIQNAEQAVELMDDFRRIGLKLAIDDFGIGYSSLVALKSFPLTRLKIDRSFIRDLDYDENDRSIARAIVSLGRELGLCVVAEGVETAKQQAFLASCRCEVVQGFHFGRPMSANKFGKLLGMTLTPLDAHFG
ncbi:sensor domain-containing protein [Roseibium sediminicola]|uniref:EAL domain-containing protein n=1 Tax=Roseibium sediminicola TaxID=2933272 RepID=A0ABT0GRK2_9HYPH|nr:EAL domain-containing protein [Roseibium sp. CAU 1639]MCK7612076.1 EAL domain-containing protein [Roseibium sp. CAU 1639]